MRYFLLVLASLLPAVAAAGPLAPGSVEAVDTPDDNGKSITVTWEEPADPSVTGFDVMWSASRDGEWKSISVVARGEGRKAFDKAVASTPYFFKVVSVAPSGRAESAVVGPVESSAQWFETAKLGVFVIGLIICVFVILFINLARRGQDLCIRKIAGLEAVDEAIGRATEMGRPVLFVPGILDLDNVQTLAGLTMLGHVTKSIAEYDTKLDVPVCRSLVMTAAREVIKQAYLEAGHPDTYYDDMVHYLTDEQFGYVAGINGIIVRDEPATCVYMGAFFAESLILAETGNGIGAIQIAGTAMPAQLPFFVAACDYTLIGEELFAASAYLSGDPKQLGSLKGQDVGKLIVMVAIVLGSLAATLANVTGSSTMHDVHSWLVQLLTV